MKKLLFIGIICAAIIFFGRQLRRPEEDTHITITQHAALTIVRLDAGSFTASLAHSTSTPRTVSQWGNDEQNRAVINGGYFNQDYSPSGFLVIDGTRIGTGKFDEDKSGLLVLDGAHVMIRDLAREPIRANEHFTYALQSYPFLIRDSKPALTSDTGKQARRSAIGVDAAGNVYLIVANDGTLTLFGFMRVLIDSGVPFTQVLNLDGGPSTGLYLLTKHQEKIIDSISRVANVIEFQLK